MFKILFLQVYVLFHALCNKDGFPLVCLATGTGTGQMEKSYFAKREWEHNKANKEVFDWLLKNNKIAAFAIISRFDWLSLDFPVSVREKVELSSFSRISPPNFSLYFL